MNDILASILFFIIAFFSVIKAYKIINKILSEKMFNQKIDLTVNEILDRKGMIYGHHKTTKKISAFDVKTKERLDDLLSAHEGLADHIKMIIRQSGIKMTITQLLAACLSGGITLTSIFIELEILETYLAIPIGLSVGSFLIYQILAYQADRRKQDFLAQFPDTIDMMVRGVKAGLNISRIIRLVSMEAKEPIAGEFNTMLQKLELGVPYEKVLVDAANEIDIQEFRFMSVALILQIENGGQLADILGNLSNIVRKRLELQLKVRAMSSESRMSAIILCALPFVFAGIMAVINPGHLQELIKPGLGQTLLKSGCGLYFLGVVSMFKITKMKI